MEVKVLPSQAQSAPQLRQHGQLPIRSPVSLFATSTKLSSIFATQPWDSAHLTQLRRSIKGYEIMNMMRKGQIEKVEKGVVRERVKFMYQIFGVVV